jgi:2-haloacid dehalogenase
MPIRALVFDAYGTLYDTQSVITLTERLCPGKGGLITQLWRLKQLEYSWLRGLMGAYEDFWSVTRAALVFALDCAEVPAEPALCEQLMANYLALDLYPEARAALTGLGGHRLAILSNGSTAMLDALVRNSGLDRVLDAVISVDGAQSYKPDPKCYALVEPALGLPKEDVLFVSSNGFDVAGAKRFGFKVAWIRRAAPAPSVSAQPGPAELFRMLRGRAETLGLEPDFRVGALTDLAALVAR